MAISPASMLPPPNHRQLFRQPRKTLVETRNRRNPGTDGSPTQRTQAELEHDRVVLLLGRVVIEFCDVIQGQDKAIVDIADTKLGFGDLFGPQVVTDSPEQQPVRVDLVLGAATTPSRRSRKPSAGCAA